MSTRSCLAVRLARHGAPEDVLTLGSVPSLPLETGEVRVNVQFAPVNPADLNLIEGRYAIKPTLPSTPGNEGVGVVIELGPGATQIAVGQSVCLPYGVGTWQEEARVPASGLLPVPEGVPPEQAAMLRVNPSTAWRMLQDFHELQEGDWVIQNAANSGVGRAVIAIARHRGVHVINMVRSAQAAASLGDSENILVESDATPERLWEITEGRGIHLGLNAVGGESALRLAQALAPGGTLVTYGAMGGRPVSLPASLLIFSDLRVRGFWLTRWWQEASAQAIEELWSEIGALARLGAFHTPIQRIYPLDQIAEAVAAARAGGRGGKILLRCSEG